MLLKAPFFYKRSLLWLPFFALTSCAVQPVLTKTESSVIHISSSDSIKGDSSINVFVAPYRNEMEKEMNEVLIISESVFERGQPEGALGNLVADIVFEKCNERYHPADNRLPDFCLLNHGGLRVPLPAGAITKGKIFELMPFDNEIVVVTLSGKKIVEMFHYIIETNGQPVAGLQLKNMNQPDFHALIKGMAFDKNKTYKVVTSDYLASGGDKMNFFKDPINIDITNYKIRDAIIDYLTSEKLKGKTLKTHPGGRITNEQ